MRDFEKKRNNVQERFRYQNVRQFLHRKQFRPPAQCRNIGRPVTRVIF